MQRRTYVQSPVSSSVGIARHVGGASTTRSTPPPFRGPRSAAARSHPPHSASSGTSGWLPARGPTLGCPSCRQATPTPRSAAATPRRHKLSHTARQRALPGPPAAQSLPTETMTPESCCWAPLYVAVGSPGTSLVVALSRCGADSIHLDSWNDRLLFACSAHDLDC